MVDGGDRPALDVRRLLVAIVVPMLVVVAVQVHSPGEHTQATDILGIDDDGADLGTRGLTALTGPATFTIAVTGEILPHPSVVEHARRAGVESGRPYDFAPMFADLRPLLRRADLAICHLEVPVAPRGAPLSGYPSFAIPADVADGIRATRWDRCSTASNHSNDKGTAGIRATIDALEAADIGHSGTARTYAESLRLPIAEVGDLRVAHLSATEWFNGNPPAESWMADQIDVDRILAESRRARRKGAHLVVVSLHWGIEYDAAGSRQQRRMARRLLRSPNVDLVVGHGPHVLQPIESFRGEYALLSVGNLVANQGSARPSTYDGVVATITFTRGPKGRYRATPPVVEPTWYEGTAGRVHLVRTALADPDRAALRPALKESLARTRSVMGEFVARR